jgi:hypothetical protein
MARQGGRVQLEQSNMCLTLNLARLANAEISRTAIKETQYLVKMSRAKAQEPKKWGVEFSGHKHVKAVIQTQPAMLCQNHTSELPSLKPLHNKEFPDTLER